MNFIFDVTKATIAECLGLTSSETDEVFYTKIKPRTDVEPVSQVIGDIINQTETKPEMRLFLMFLMGKLLERDFIIKGVADVLSGACVPQEPRPITDKDAVVH